MKVNDFTFADKTLADFNCICCNFDSNSGMVEVGVELKLNQEKSSGSDWFNLYSTTYDEPFTLPLSICVNMCNSDIDHLTVAQARKIQKWLSLKNKKFRINCSGYENIYWIGNFSAKQVMINDQIIGFNLTFTANTPYALQDDLLINCDLSANIRETEFEINSDKYGCINADYIITCKEAGDLTVSSYYVDQENKLLIIDRQFKIDNCSMGEVITINGTSQLVTSNINGRQLGKDCNFLLPRLINTYQDVDETVKNRIVVNRPCTIKITYAPIAMIAYGYKG